MSSCLCFVDPDDEEIRRLASCPTRYFEALITSHPLPAEADLNDVKRLALTSLFALCTPCAPCKDERDACEGLAKSDGI